MPVSPLLAWRDDERDVVFFVVVDLGATIFAAVACAAASNFADAGNSADAGESDAGKSDADESDADDRRAAALFADVRLDVVLAGAAFSPGDVSAAGACATGDSFAGASMTGASSEPASTIDVVARRGARFLATGAAVGSSVAVVVVVSWISEIASTSSPLRSLDAPLTPTCAARARSSGMCSVARESLESEPAARTVRSVTKRVSFPLTDSLQSRLGAGTTVACGRACRSWLSAGRPAVASGTLFRVRSWHSRERHVV